MPIALALFPGSEHLAFRCTGCGACCRGLRVAITHRDLERLALGQGEAAAELVQWLAPDEVDMTGEPSSFVELGEGRRLMVLAQRGGSCRLLGADNRCSVYAARPADCRLFPFALERDAEAAPRALSLLGFSECDYERDGTNDWHDLVLDDAKRWQELAAYQERVARWNRLSRHRRRLGRVAGNSAEFLRFLALYAESRA